LLLSTERPFAADQFEPGHVTASTMIVSSRGRRVLLIRHPTLDRWLQPGGHVDPTDPSTHAAARREAFEETGLDVEPASMPFDVDVHPIPARGDRPRHGHYDVRYLAITPEEPAPGGSEGIAARWCDGPTALRLVDDRGLLRMLRKARAQGLLD
jgi:8-oxo-dGTP pyrophosphatase MutT (NUDIX family)